MRASPPDGDDARSLDGNSRRNSRCRRHRIYAPATQSNHRITHTGCHNRITSRSLFPNASTVGHTSSKKIQHMRTSKFAQTSVSRLPTPVNLHRSAGSVARAYGCLPCLGGRSSLLASPVPPCRFCLQCSVAAGKRAYWSRAGGSHRSGRVAGWEWVGAAREAAAHERNLRLGPPFLMQAGLRSESFPATRHRLAATVAAARAARPRSSAFHRLPASHLNSQPNSAVLEVVTAGAASCADELYDVSGRMCCGSWDLGLAVAPGLRQDRSRAWRRWRGARVRHALEDAVGPEDVSARMVAGDWSFLSLVRGRCLYFAVAAEIRRRARVRDVVDGEHLRRVAAGGSAAGAELAGSYSRDLEGVCHRWSSLRGFAATTEHFESPPTGSPVQAAVFVFVCGQLASAILPVVRQLIWFQTAAAANLCCAIPGRLHMHLGAVSRCPSCVAVAACCTDRARLNRVAVCFRTLQVGPQVARRVQVAGSSPPWLLLLRSVIRRHAYLVTSPRRHRQILFALQAPAAQLVGVADPCGHQLAASPSCLRGLPVVDACSPLAIRTCHPAQFLQGTCASEPQFVPPQ